MNWLNVGAVESGEKGLLGHDRIDCPRGYSGENCAYGYDGSGQYFVMLLLIDDGVVGVGHRKNIVYNEFKGLGVAIRDHIGYKYDAVQNFSYTNDVLKEEERRAEEEESRREQERQQQLELRAQEFQQIMNSWDIEELKAADATRSLTYLKRA